MAVVSQSRLWVTRLAVITLLLTSVLVALGAWTRLSDAGLGCPDWPTCYGSITVPLTDAAIARAHELYPNQPLVTAKAWPEMIHRHFAKTVGLLCIIMAIIAVRARREKKYAGKAHRIFAAAGVFTGAFGAWTVTMKLFPPVVTGHLLFGFATFTTLFLLVLRLSPFLKDSQTVQVLKLKPLVLLALLAVIAQILLGGWTASNYAATMCVELPICQGDWSQYLAWQEAFSFHSYTGTTYEYAPHLDAAAKLTIHVAHRFGAIAVTSLVLLLALLLAAQSAGRYRRFAMWILLVLTVQIGLGISNIVFHLPLPVAVMHNVVALFLLQLMVALTYSVWHESSKPLSIGKRLNSKEE